VRITVNTERSFFYVFSNPGSEERDREFNSWYDEVHVRDALAVPGIVSAQRFRLHEVHHPLFGEPGPPRYLAVYELEGSPQEVFDNITEAAKAGRMDSPAGLMADAVAYLWEPISERVTTDSVEGA